MGEDAARVLFGAKACERRDDGECDGRHGDELEQPREDGRDEVEEVVERLDTEPSEDGADNQRAEPEHELALLVRLVAPERFLCGGFHIVMIFL